MNLSMIAYIVGAVMEIEAGLMLLPALVGLIYGEKSALSFVICSSCGGYHRAIPILRKPKNTAIYAREGFVATALSWLTLSAVGAVPFCMTGQIPHYINALFEMVSGFTTTGASILYEVESMDHCMLFWRSFSHWIGGMGVLVFMLAILPMAGGQNLHLMRAESPGPTVGKLVPKLLAVRHLALRHLSGAVHRGLYPAVHRQNAPLRGAVSDLWHSRYRRLWCAEFQLCGILHVLQMGHHRFHGPVRHELQFLLPGDFEKIQGRRKNGGDPLVSDRVLLCLHHHSV